MLCCVFLVTIFSGRFLCSARWGHALPFCFSVTFSFSAFFYNLRATDTQYRFTAALGRQPGERGAARLQSPFPFRVFSPSPPLSSFPIPLKTRCKDAHFHNVAQNTKGRNLFHEIVGMVQPVRSPQEWGELWKRERERKPVRGERISSLLRYLPSQRGCRSHTGRWVMRDPFG